jgi:hypothetical protein
MSAPKPVRVLVACIALGFPFSGCSEGAAQEDSTLARELACGPATVVATLPGSIGEASGIARDPRRDDLFWLHNDSGNETVLFGVDTTGTLLATARISSVTNRDIEDVAIGRCGSEWCVYLADIGDNQSSRSSIQIHRTPLPALPDPHMDASKSGGGVDQELSALASWELDYPDGPRDAEGIVIDDARGQLSIISKGRGSAGVVLYSIDVAEFEQAGDSPRTLRRIGRLAIPIGGNSSQLITAADLSPDGTLLALRSYASLHLLPWSGASSQDTTLAPNSAPLFLAFEPQGEGVAWGSDGEVLYLASEGRNGRPPQLSRIRCQAP